MVKQPGQAAALDGASPVEQDGSSVLLSCFRTCGVHHGCGHPHPGQDHQHPLGQEPPASQVPQPLLARIPTAERTCLRSILVPTNGAAPSLGASRDLTVCYQVQLQTLLNSRGVWRDRRVGFSQPPWSPLLQDRLLETGKVTGKGASSTPLARSPLSLQGEGAAFQA